MKGTVLAAALMVLLFSCGKSPEEEREIRKYREIGAYIHGVIEMQERYCEAIDAAEGVDDVEQAIRKRTEDLLRLAGEVNVLEKKYPEFNLSTDTKVKDYLADELAAVERLKIREEKARRKVELFMEDKKILNAYNDQIAKLEALEKKKTEDTMPQHE